jgi:DNA polymerase I-like protein with 3'-5' exonuclease and polymerase domains
MGRHTTRNTVISKQLEEHIDVPFWLVGRPKWLLESIEVDALPPELIIRVENSTDLCGVHEWLSDQKALGIDIETGGAEEIDGLDPLSATSRVLLFQLGTKERVYVIDPSLVPEFRKELQDENILKIGQNIVFDFEFLLSKYSIHINRMYDTMLAEQMLEAGLEGLGVGLDVLAENYPPALPNLEGDPKRFHSFSKIL